MNIEIPNLSAPQRALLEKYVPVVLAVGIAWLVARGIRKAVWTVIGMYWAVHWMH